MINISKSSWHYRFNNWCDDNHYPEYRCKNLCSYFWYSVKNLLCGTLFGAAILFVACIVIYNLAIAQAHIHIVVWSLVAAIVLPIVAIWLLRKYIGSTEMPTPPRVSSTYSLISEYTKAKKDKYCPLINFVGGK